MVSDAFVRWAQGLSNARWGLAGVSREDRRMAQVTGTISPDTAWRLAWGALAYERLESLEKNGVLEALWFPAPEGHSPFQQSLEPLPNSATYPRELLSSNWLRLAQRSQTDAEASRWATALGGADQAVVGAYLAGMSGSSSYFQLGELSIESWEEVVLSILERIPTALLLDQREVLEKMKHAHQPPELEQLDRWEAALSRHQPGLERWIEADLLRQGRRSPVYSPRSWVWLLDKVFEKGPDLVDRPACGFAVVLGSLLAADIHRQTDNRLAPTPTLDALNRALPTLPGPGQWAGSASGELLEWVEKRRPGFETRVRSFLLDRGLPSPFSAPKPKPRF